MAFFQTQVPIVEGFSARRSILTVRDQTAAERGRPILIAVRVPDSVEYASAIGLDMVRWMKEDLIDILVVGGYFHLNPWETSVALGRRYGVPVYPSLSEPRFRGPSQRVRYSIECYRGRALDAWNAGVDGIYMFNYFNPRSRMWWEVGDPKALETMDQVYPAGTTSVSPVNLWLAGGMEFMNLPVALPEKPVKLVPGRTATIEIPVAAEVNKTSKMTPTVKARLLIDDLEKAKDIEVKLNDQPLVGGDLVGGWLEYAVEPSVVKKGINHLEIAVLPTGDDITLLDAVLEIRYKLVS